VSSLPHQPYRDFLAAKAQLGDMAGFAPLWMPDFLFDFQRALVEWAIRKGRAAIFADCGLGKTPMQLTWAENVVRHTNGRVLILTPLAVGAQTIREAEKFGIEAARSHKGETPAPIVVANYERLHHFDPADFAGVVCDESSILKSFDGATRQAVTEFMRRIQYRLLCTATAAPNDYVELGTSSEALGDLGHTDMLMKFFKNDQHTIKARVYLQKGANHADRRDAAKWRFKGHAEIPFWRWVCSWARAVRRPSDLGFDDGRFILPPLLERDHMVDVAALPDGMLFALPAVGLKEQRDERRRSIEERCGRVADMVNGHDEQALVWCHLNDEGDLLAESIKGARQISGSDTDEAKEEAFLDFASGKLRVLVTKPKIGAWGLNFQNCRRITFFPSHSFEQYYQGVRRCWRFGQTRPVEVDVVTTEGEKDVLANLQRKAKAADRMFSQLVEHMTAALATDRTNRFTHNVEAPSWL
jgi:hypothetical protein